ncbi:hypothetical protein MBLNU13_g01012t1 [Cladosporium sp. NU13]
MSDAHNAGSSSHSAHSSISKVDGTSSIADSTLSHGSFEERRDYAGFGDKKVRRRAGGDDDFDNDGDDDASDHDHQEHDRLLVDDVAAALDSRSQDATATTLPDDDGEPALPPAKAKPRQIAWSELPKKGQLAILTLARLSEPLTQQGLQSYMFYQLKSFTLPNGEAPSDSTVARQAGVLAAAFTGAQFLTAIMWGRLADSATFGRKRVILIGLLGTAIGSLGFGFSKSFAAAVFWRCLGGVLNGNIGVMRTMISEIVREKKFQSRAFLLMPMTFNIGVIVGPLLGGWLADPVGSYPGVFGPGGSIGGEKGVEWLMRFPYALPNVINACFLLGSAMGILFGLEETLEALRDKPDYPLQFRRWVFRAFSRRKSPHEYIEVADSSTPTARIDVEMQSSTTPAAPSHPKPKQRLPFRRIWTRNVILTFLAHGLLAMHVGTFNNLWFVFLSTPRYDAHNKHTSSLPSTYKPHAPFTFTGGLSLPPPSIGTALAILGVIGITLQLLLFPTLSFKLGTTRSFRLSLLLFPISYLLAPYLAIIPSSTAPPAPASGAWIWLGITLVLAVQVTARTFALPSTAILSAGERTPPTESSVSEQRPQSAGERTPPVEVLASEQGPETASQRTDGSAHSPSQRDNDEPRYPDSPNRYERLHWYEDGERVAILFDRTAFRDQLRSGYLESLRPYIGRGESDHEDGEERTDEPEEEPAPPYEYRQEAVFLQGLFDGVTTQRALRRKMEELRKCQQNAQDAKLVAQSYQTALREIEPTTDGEWSMFRATEANIREWETKASKKQDLETRISLHVEFLEDRADEEARSSRESFQDDLHLSRERRQLGFLSWDDDLWEIFDKYQAACQLSTKIDSDLQQLNAYKNSVNEAIKRSCKRDFNRAADDFTMFSILTEKMIFGDLSRISDALEKHNKLLDSKLAAEKLWAFSGYRKSPQQRWRV